MAGMLVSRPFARGRTPLEQVWPYFPDQRHDDVWSSFERFNDGRC
jgi:hypothetical protein